MIIFQRQDVVKLVNEWYTDSHGVMVQLDGFIATERQVAIYTNQDLGHPGVGQPQLASCGHPEAMFPDDPPEQFPDLEHQIGWRFRLVGIWKGD